MKALVARTVVIVVAVVLVPTSVAAGSLFFVTNELGYQGTIANITDGTGPWLTADPITGERNADVFLTMGAPQIWTDSNIILSSWFSHTMSNQNDSFMQLYVDGQASPWTASGGWDSTLKTFTATVTGSNATYATSFSRFWQPDSGTAPGLTFLNYTYSLTAVFGASAIVDSGWYVNNGPALSITGSFVGTFLAGSGDMYSFNILLDRAWSTPPDSSFDGADYSPFTQVGAPVPEPGTLGLLGLALLGVSRRMRRRRQ